MAQYGKSEYWEDRYQKDKEPFDWYQRYGGLKDIVTQYVQPTFQILNVGAGNSRKFPLSQVALRTTTDSNNLGCRSLRRNV